MPWYAVLIVALASIAFVLALLVHVALKAWRLAKHGAAVSARVTPLVDGLSRRGDEVTAAVDRLSTRGEELTASVARMQRSIARLQAIAQSFNDALRPYYLIAGWLSGERDWRGLGY